MEDIICVFRVHSLNEEADTICHVKINDSKRMALSPTCGCKASFLKGITLKQPWKVRGHQQKVGMGLLEEAMAGAKTQENGAA